MKDMITEMILPVFTAAVVIWLWRKKKTGAAVLRICLIGTAVGACLMVYESRTGDVRQVTEIDGTTGSNALESVDLEVQADSGEPVPVTIRIPEQQYTGEEAAAILKKQASALDSMILGKNTSFDRIEWNLELPDTFAETGTAVSWSSSRPDLITWDGTLEADIPEGTEAVLYGSLRLGDEEYTWEKNMILYPSREKSAWNDVLQKKTEEQNLGNSPDEKIRLPGEWNGRKLTWYEKTSKTGGLLCLLMIIAALASAYAQRRKKEEITEKHRNEMTVRYPELVCKLRLFTSAGLSLRQCFRRLASDDSEIGRCNFEIENGTPEEEAYAHLGERVGTPEYRRLSLLLCQSRKRGGSQFSLQLAEEAQNALETRKRNARALGEKAAVRMALPLGLMLCDVLILIMVPAMLSFS